MKSLLASFMAGRFFFFYNFSTYTQSFQIQLKCLSPLHDFNKYRKFMHVQDALQRNESYSMFCFVFYQTTKSPKIGRFPPYCIQKEQLRYWELTSL